MWTLGFDPIICQLSAMSMTPWVTLHTEAAPCENAACSMRGLRGHAGCTLCAMNNVEEAKEHFEAAIRIMPTHLEVGPEFLPVGL